MDGVIDVLNDIPEPRTIELEPDRINALLGTDISEADMVEYLRRLEIPVEGNEIRVPSWRPDLVGMADIAEEVGRLFGYNNIPHDDVPRRCHGGRLYGGHEAREPRRFPCAAASATARS